MRLLLSPHSDDECLFAAYTIIRHPTLVVICTDYDGDRGPTAEERRQESINAMHILGAPVVFLGIPESRFEKEGHQRLYHMTNMADIVLVPAYETNGHKHHNLLSSYGGISPQYSTYSYDRLKPTGDIEIVPTDKEFELKKRALACYKSQWKLNPQHFEAVLEARSEFYISR